MLTYASTLKSITSDRGTYHMEFDHYDECRRRSRRRSSRSTRAQAARGGEVGVTRDCVYIRELGEHVGETVLSRVGVPEAVVGKIRFLVLRDGTGYLQCVAGVKDVPRAFERATA
jgi:hypothetical protein